MNFHGKNCKKRQSQPIPRFQAQLWNEIIVNIVGAKCPSFNLLFRELLPGTYVLQPVEFTALPPGPVWLYVLNPHFLSKISPLFTSKISPCLGVDFVGSDLCFVDISLLSFFTHDGWMSKVSPQCWFRVKLKTNQHIGFSILISFLVTYQKFVTRFIPAPNNLLRQPRRTFLAAEMNSLWKLLFSLSSVAVQKNLHEKPLTLVRQF